jgi:hypothetical protein
MRIKQTAAIFKIITVAGETPPLALNSGRENCRKKRETEQVTERERETERESE